MELLQDYVVIMVVAICMCIGYIIKNSLTMIKNKYIPLILAVVGVVMNIWINMSFTPAILLGGLASGLASTGLYEASRSLSDNKKGES